MWKFIIDILSASRRALNVAWGQFTCLCILSVFFCAESFAIPIRKLTYTAKNVSLITVFDEIKKQTGAIVFYSNELLNDKEKVSVNYIAIPLNEVMEDLLKNRPLIYQFSDDYILIKRKQALVGTEKTSIVKPTNVLSDTLVAYVGKVMSSSTMKGVAGVSIVNSKRNLTVVSLSLIHI